MPIDRIVNQCTAIIRNLAVHFNSIYFVLGRSKRGCNSQDIEHVIYIGSQTVLRNILC